MKWVTYVFLAFIATSCGSNKPAEQFDQFIGLWQTHTSESDMYEEWTKQKDGVLNGKSYVMNDSDTMIFERVELKKENEDVFYIPTVKDQNNNQAVKFKLITSNDSLFMFENKDHDFPQRITYSFTHQDSLVARIEGFQNEEYRREEFFFHRVK